MLDHDVRNSFPGKSEGNFDVVADKVRVDNSWMAAAEILDVLVA